ncbi:MinD/ParA family ATP-binding protein [Nocardia sp.]|uniref:MinD/ParA family ATP-binding protein n=1 Tax=Nocardia sp. TaxID=1821 RepID=UPI0039C9CC93
MPDPPPGHGGTAPASQVRPAVEADADTPRGSAPAEQPPAWLAPAPSPESGLPTAPAPEPADLPADPSSAARPSDTAARPAPEAGTSADGEPAREQPSPYAATTPPGQGGPLPAAGGPSPYAPAPEAPYTGYGTMDGQPAYGPGSNPVYGLESPALGEQPYGSPGPRGGWAGPEGPGPQSAPAAGQGPGGPAAGQGPGGTAQAWPNGAPHRAPVSEPSGHPGPNAFGRPPQAPGAAPGIPGESRDPQTFAQQPYPQSPSPDGAAPPWNAGGPPAAAPPTPGGWGAAAQHHPASAPPPSLDDVPLRRAKKAPGSGWRKAVHHMSGGAINPGMSAEERRLQELVARIRQPVRGDYRIAVLSLKGGVGKTTTTMGLGSIFASVRGDRVIAVDANPDFGTLSQRVSLQTRSTVRDLLLDPSIERYSDVRRHTSQATSRLEVLASERDPAASESFNDEEYRAVARILQRFYNIILTDCGTGLMHSAMTGVLDLAHSLVLVSSAAIDGARSAAATLDWLSLHGHDHLVRNAVVVINLPREGSPNVGVQQLREYFLARCRAVHIIPYDAHLSEGAEIDLHRLSKQAKRAYVELAATVADGFSADHRRFHH